MSILQFKNANCKNCYKCVRCCPVKSIRVKDHRAEIIESECILCGNCTAVCPQNAKEDISDVPQIKRLVGKKALVASVAPSFGAYFGCGFDELRDALKKVGFDGAFETAEGAYAVKSQFERDEAAAGERTVISSCCSTVNLFIEKYYPSLIGNLAAVVTPMQAHAKMLRERFENAAIIFISPCISKKSECDGENGADFCITFDELEALFEEENVAVARGDECKDMKFTRQFPLSGGIIGCMKKAEGRTYIAVDGHEQCRAALEEIAGGGLKDCFVEMSFCRGGCSGGPSFRKRGNGTLEMRMKIKKAAGEDYACDFSPQEDIALSRSFSAQEIYREPPTERQLAAILKKMGKNSPDDELNCGMCGYSSCREKAKAVFDGRAEISMCLPYMKERAESLSDAILSITPNAVVACGTDLKIHQINNAACELFGAKQSELIGKPVSEILDEFDFVEMITSDKTQTTKYAYLSENGAYVEQQFRYDKACGIVVCVMKNITLSRRRKNSAMKARVQAADMADEIVEKQLRVVHEIAALLGETAAETKAAVHNLKETIMSDSGDEDL